MSGLEARSEFERSDTRPRDKDEDLTRRALHYVKRQTVPTTHNGRLWTSWSLADWRGNGCKYRTPWPARLCPEWPSGLPLGQSTIIIWPAEAAELYSSIANQTE